MNNQLQPDSEARRLQAIEIAEQVPDPELPFLTLGDLGIVRGARITKSQIVLSLSPTYSGCPAVQVIEEMVSAALSGAGIDAQIERVLSPPWCSDWITERGRERLLANGIAAPVSGSAAKPALFENVMVCCPACKSDNTELLSDFGSTPCKAQYRCLSCLEPFDYFKCV